MKRFFSQHLNTSAIIASTMMLMMASAYFLWFAFPHIVAILTRSSIDQVCGCVSAFAWSQSPWLNSAMMVLSALSLFVLVRVVSGVLWHFWKTHRFVAMLPLIGSELMWHQGKRYIILLVDLETDLLCTVGVLRPRIVMSKTTQRRFSDAEEHAALLHEIGHIRKRHLLVRLIAFPLLTQKYRREIERGQEYAADLFALAHTSRMHLLSALTRFCASFSTPTAVAAFGSTEERFRFLLDATVPRSSFRLHLAIFSAILSVFFFLFAHSVQWASGVEETGVAPAQCLAQKEIAREILIQENASAFACVSIGTSFHMQTSNESLLTEGTQSPNLNR